MMIKNLPLFILIALLTGCGGGSSPGSGGMILSDGHYAFYGYQGHDDLLFLIVTDGAIGSKGYGCSSNVFLGPSWAGSIKPANASQPQIAYKSGKHSILIGDVKYNLGNGRSFIVITGKDKADIQQIKTSPRDRIENMVKTDTRFDF